MATGSPSRELDIKREEVDVKIRDIVGQQEKQEVNEKPKDDTGEEVKESTREESHQEVDELLSHQTPRWRRVWGNIWR